VGQKKRKAGNRKSPGNPNWKKGQSGNPAAQFKPGVSGNPDGRPKKKLIDWAIEEALLANRSKFAKEIAAELVKKAAKGNIYAIQLASERTEGKPRQAHELSGIDGDSIRVIFENVAAPKQVGK
jgi:Family of unknown function (DUF5681)